MNSRMGNEPQSSQDTDFWSSHTTARSEADDKRLWHKRWRASERDQISKVGADTDHVAGHRNAVSSTWDIAKDGKALFDLSHQREIAERIAARHARLLPERKPFRRGCWPSGVRSSVGPKGNCYSDLQNVPSLIH